MDKLKITDVETIPLSYRYKKSERWKWSGGTKLQRNAVITKVSTNENINGLGEIGESSYLPLSIGKIVNEQFKDMLVGENPLNIELLWKKMYNRSSQFGRKGVIISVISGLEIALWDIMGKYFNEPVYKLLGGSYRNKIRAYASAGMDKNIDKIIEEVKHYEKIGYKGIKIRIGEQEISKDIKKVKEIRESLNIETDLMVDAGQCYVDKPWNFNKALKVCRELENLNLLWIEEPLHPDDTEGYIRLNSKIDIPIAAGENEYTKEGFRNLITKRALDIAQPDVTHSGGILECKKIAALAESFHIDCAPHIFAGGIGLMANMHFIISTPNILIMEHDRTYNPLREKLLLQKPKFKEGFLYLDEEIPGLGVKLTEEVKSEFSFEEKKAIEKDDFKLKWEE